MEYSRQWLDRELLDAFYKIADDYRMGLIDDDTMKYMLELAAERYDRTVGAEKVKSPGLFSAV